MEAFAAAAVKMQMPELPEDVAVDLPAQKRGRGDSKRGFADRREGRRERPSDRHSERHSGGRPEHHPERHSDRRLERRYGGERVDERGGYGRHSTDRRARGRYDERSRERGRERGDQASEPVDKRTVKRVRLNGEAYDRKKSRKFR